MKSLIFTLLIVGAHAQTNLLSGKTLVSSVAGLVKNVPSLLENPRSGVTGLGLLAPTALIFSISVGKLSEAVDNFSEFVDASTDPESILTQDLDCIIRQLDQLIIASYNFSQSIDEQTDELGYLNFFNFSRVPATLIELSDAHNGFRSCIMDKINGIPAGSTKSLIDFTEKIKQTSDAQITFAEVADPVHGITGLVAGSAALIFSIAENYGKLSQSLDNFSAAISNSTETSFGDLVRAVDDLAQTEKTVSEAFFRLSDLS